MAGDPSDAPTGFPEPPGKDPGDKSKDPTPYTNLNTPVGEPDPTEWPDPYDTREDPKGPPDGMSFPGDGTAHTPVGAESTSDPVADDDIEADRANAPDRDVMDD